MEERYINVQAFGKAEKKIPDAAGEKIIDAMYNDLRAGRYYEACKIYAEKVQYYMDYVPFYLSIWFQLLAALAVGGISVGAMVSGSGGKVTTNAGTYADRAHMGIRARRDDYIRTSVTKRKKPESSGGSSGGGSSHHSSSGGHSHSSAGRHF